MKPLFLILLSALTSCAPCRLLSTDTRDSMSVVSNVCTLERLVRDTVFVEIPAQREAHTVDTVSHLENDYAVSDAHIKSNGTLYHDLRTKPQKCPVSFDRKDTERIRTDTIYFNRVKTNMVEVTRALTGWQQMQIKGFWVLLILVAVMFRKGVAAIVRRIIS